MESNEKKSKVRKKHPREGANPFSILSFSWTLPIFWSGRKKEMEQDDLFDVLKDHKASYLTDKFENAWFKELNRCRIFNKTPNLKKIILKIFGWKLVMYGVLAFLIEMVLCIAQPLLLGGLLDYFSSKDGNVTYAYLYAAGIVACSGSSVWFHCYMMGLSHIGMKVRVALSSLIYRKAMRLSQASLIRPTIGHLVNLMSNDVGRFDYCFIYLHMLWIGPVETLIVTYFVWRLIGLASLIGLFSLVIFIPFQAWLGKKVSMLRLKTAIRTDERVRLMNEIISGIQVIKMYTWEKPFAFLVSQARRKEINVITKSSYCRGIMLSFIMFHTRTSIFLSILAYILFGNKDISAQKVFVVTCFYNTLRQTMTVFFPQGIAMVAECLISIKRIKAFLMYDETTNPAALNLLKLKKESEMKDIPKDEANGIIPNDVPSDEKKKQGIFLENVTAKWIGEQSENTLTNVTLDVIPGKLTSVIGPVGAGKSSLLHVMLKELPISSGSIRVNGTLSYASQEPWLFVGSVRQNILFGMPYDKDRYRQVIRVCALTTDLEQLPHGDKTLIGERGISLSGGQRARVNLARAVYKKADIYLLDDPLSAVDTHVGKHLFEDCITGYLKEKTVILITHQLQYLNNVDHIVLLDNGVVTAEGTFSELQSKGLDFTELLVSNREELIQSKITYSRQSSVQSVASSVDDIHRVDPVEEAEARTRGTVSSGVYMKYLKAGGGCCLLFFMLILFISAQGFASGGDYFTAYWVNAEEINDFSDEDRNFYIYIFAGLTLGTIVVTLVRSFLFFYMCMKASMWLHNSMFDSITRATMRFFNVNSSGRILNRFSKDMGSIDELLPSSLADVLQIGLALLAIIIVVAVTNPWLLIPTGACAIIFYFLRIFYLSTSRSVKRLEGITRSPVFAHINASLQGLTTIRAFNAQQILQHEFDNHQDLHSSAWYLFIASSRAFGFWLDSVCLVYIALVTFSFLVLMPDSFGGAVGLAITQSIGLVGMFQWGMRQSAELENQMTSVERVLEYADLESEPPLEAPPDKKPKESWPEKGEINFEHVSLRYSPTEPWVLKNLNFTIAPQQKVGIVGRTGAGKSSLISALFRLSETEGLIKLDGIESKSVGLHDLRSKISIIPQEPVLFSGSLRKNLDPFDQFPDDILWSALEQVELKESVGELAGGLSAKMAEGGANFSVGQRQLVCLARAIVRNNRVLVLDEATANVDPQTDSLIQKTIRTKFALCTVLTIAHRLNTVMDSDKVLVMDAGALVEFDHPHLLLQNEYGFLSKMVEQTGKATAETLKQVAYNSYQEHLKKSPEKSQ